MQSKIFFLKKIGGRYLENLNSTFIISLVNFFFDLNAQPARFSAMEFCVLEQVHTNPGRDLKNNASDA